VNVILHLISSLLVWRLFSKFNLRWAWLGGFLFAIHPAVVESVAWMAELKNALSLPPLLLAACAWIDFDRSDRRNDYLRSLGLFFLAELCKPTVIMFPFIILLYAWWRRSRIERKDLKFAAPFFFLSLVMGIITLHFVQPVIGQIPLGIASRAVLAGQALVYYFADCVWPFGLLPIYPKWIIDPFSLRQWLPWPILIVVLIMCWHRRNTWGRHALLGFGFFLINLAPFVGFTQGAYMGFTWIMDHMLYLPLIGLVGLFVGGVERLEQTLPLLGRPFTMGVLAVIAVFFAVESHTYAAMYGNPLSLWTYAAGGNPGSWVVRTNLGEALAQRGRIEEAVFQFQAAIHLDSDEANVHADLGMADSELGLFPEAEHEYEIALQLRPRDANFYYDLGNVLVRLRQFPEAMGRYQEALRINPQNAAAHYAIGGIFFGTNRMPEAIDQFNRAVQIDPKRAEFHNALANAMLRNNQLPDAINEFKKSLQIDPNQAEVHSALGKTFLQTNQLPEASAQLQQAVQLDPTNARARTNLGVAFARQNEIPQATEQFQTAIRLDPNEVEAHSDLGTIFLVIGQFTQAIEQFQTALRIKPDFVDAQNKLAKALALRQSVAPPAPSP
jgi:tetratricopeptide (TPR) repeat protein